MKKKQYKRLLQKVIGISITNAHPYAYLIPDTSRNTTKQFGSFTASTIPTTLHQPLTSLPLSDRPRERLQQRGVQVLSNHELLMVILGRGMKDRDVAAIASDILNTVAEDPEQITLEKLTALKGVGAAKAMQIIASFEFARRFLVKDEVRIRNIDDILELVRDLRTKKQEHFVTLTLNGAGTLIEKRIMFIGTVDQSLVHPREIFADAITDRAAAIIFIHNHPADDATPSPEDISITQRLIAVAKLVGIDVIDHVIISRNSHYSFQASGLLQNIFSKKENPE